MRMPLYGVLRGAVCVLGAAGRGSTVQGRQRLFSGQISGVP